MDRRGPGEQGRMDRRDEMKLRDRVAAALDASLENAANKRGIYTDKVRDTLAAYLDGVAKLRASTVRKYVDYLRA